MIVIILREILVIFLKCHNNFIQQRCKSIVIFFSNLLTCLSAMMLSYYLCTNAGKKEAWQDTNTGKVLWFKRY
jgi:hypothetical protein